MNIKEAKRIVSFMQGYFDVNLLSKRRFRGIVEARAMCYAWFREHTELSLLEIGSLFGGKDHSTVINGLKLDEHLRDWSKDYAQMRKKLFRGLDIDINSKISVPVKLDKDIAEKFELLLSSQDENKIIKHFIEFMGKNDTRSISYDEAQDDYIIKNEETEAMVVIDRSIADIWIRDNVNLTMADDLVVNGLLQKGVVERQAEPLEFVLDNLFTQEELLFLCRAFA